MTIKVARGVLTQTVADTTIEQYITLPINSTNVVQPPAIKLRQIEFYLNEASLILWPSSTIASQYVIFLMEKWPKTEKSIRLRWPLVFPNGTIGAQIQNNFIWNPPPDFPEVVGDTIHIKLDSLGTGTTNSVEWEIYYEEVFLSEAQATLGFIS